MARRISRIPRSTAVVFAVVALVVGFFAGRISAPKDAGGPSPQEVPAADQGAATEGSTVRGAYTEKKLDLPPSPYKGPEDAPVVIWEVSDFQCPFCSRASGTVEEVAAKYPQDVRIVFKHRPLPFHDNARQAAIAAMAAAEQGHFWKYHDLLFANQKALGRDKLIEYAGQIPGLDVEKFKKDLDDPKLAAKVDSDDAAAQAVGATGTPAFFINGVKLSGAKPFAEFKAEIDKQLEKAKALQDQGVARGDVARRLTAQSGAGAGAFIKYIVDESPAPKPKAPPKREAKKEDTKTVWKVPVDPSKEFVKGPKDAPVTIVEFSDFQCPFCSKVLPTYKKIFEEYGGKVRKVFKHNPLPFHKDAPLAAKASIAAGQQGKFWEMHELLFANQKALKREDLKRYAEQLGLDMAKFEAALDSKELDDKIAADQALAEKVKAQGTPNAFINGRKLTGAKPYEEFKAVIDEELKKTDAMLKKGVKPSELYDKLIADGKMFVPPPPLDPKTVSFKLDGAPSKGPESAKITLVEFSDFQCPYCSRVAQPVEALQAKYPEQIRVVFKQFPLSFHKNAQKAAEASLAAHAQGRFWEMHDIMFENAKALEEDKLILYAQQLGLDMDKFKSDLRTGKFEQAVKADFLEGQRAGVRGTPTLFFNGRKYNASGRTVADFEKVLAAELGLKIKN